MPRVVLAEDDQTMVSLLTTLLRMDGFEVSALDADQDIVSTLKSDPPDALIMDVHLTGQNGLDVLDAVRDFPARSQIRIIMISGMNVRDECLKRGADEFLLKPFMADDLIKVLRTKSPPS